MKVFVIVQLAEASGNSFLLTQQETERIEELLRDLEEEEDDSELLNEPQVQTHPLRLSLTPFRFSL